MYTRLFRRTVGTRIYIEVRKTMDTLMGLMEAKWPAICKRAVEEEQARILQEQIKAEKLSLKKNN
eukprot:TRINITY_DN5187_c0_g1_i1.p2 TRINITY_DN5187_c0_g1~~TRINITY_DN5187_c0_g1_i1.p2  ORF type:complete len:65 (-),score=12.31 TRINITY_DN5187_c0_g1_i1:161-355(-)